MHRPQAFWATINRFVKRISPLAPLVKILGPVATLVGVIWAFISTSDASLVIIVIGITLLVAHAVWALGNWVRSRFLLRRIDLDSRSLYIRPASQGLSPYEVGSELPGSIPTQAANRIVSRLESPDCRIFILYGPVGSGKSSLLRGGVGTRLTRIASICLVTQPLAYYFQHQAESGIKRLAGALTLIRNQCKIVFSATDKARYLLIDQFEDLLSSCASPQEFSLLSDFLARPGDDQEIKTVIALRQDYYYALAELPIFAKVSVRDQLRIRDLSIQDAADLISEIAEKDHARIDAEFATFLATDLAIDGVVRPVELSLVLSLFDNTFSTIKLRDRGGARGILSAYFQSCLDEAPDSRIARLVLRSLVDNTYDPPRRRREVVVDEILGSMDVALDDVRVRSLVLRTLDFFTDRRVAIRTKEGAYELAHDYLLASANSSTLAATLDRETADRLLFGFVHQALEDPSVAIPSKYLPLIRQHASRTKLQEPVANALISKSVRRARMRTVASLTLAAIAICALVLVASVETVWEPKYVSGSNQYLYYMGSNSIVLEPGETDPDTGLPGGPLTIWNPTSARRVTEFHVDWTSIPGIQFLIFQARADYPIYGLDLEHLERAPVQMPADLEHATGLPLGVRAQLSPMRKTVGLSWNQVVNGSAVHRISMVDTNSGKEIATISRPYEQQDDKSPWPGLSRASPKVLQVKHVDDDGRRAILWDPLRPTGFILWTRRSNEKDNVEDIAIDDSQLNRAISVSVVFDAKSNTLRTVSISPDGRITMLAVNPSTGKILMSTRYMLQELSETNFTARLTPANVSVGTYIMGRFLQVLISKAGMNSEDGKIETGFEFAAMIKLVDQSVLARGPATFATSNVRSGADDNNSWFSWVDKDWSVNIVNLATGKEMTIDKTAGLSRARTFLHPQGKLMALVGPETTLSIYDRSTKKVLFKHEWQGKIQNVLFSVDGKSLLVVSGERDADVLDPATGKWLGKIPFAENILAFKLEGDTVIAWSTQRVVKYKRVKRIPAIGTFEVPHIFRR